MRQLCVGIESELWKSMMAGQEYCEKVKNVKTNQKLQVKKYASDNEKKVQIQFLNWTFVINLSFQ